MTHVNRKPMLINLTLVLCFITAMVSACQPAQETEGPLPTATMEVIASDGHPPQKKSKPPMNHKRSKPHRTLSFLQQTPLQG